MLHLRFTVSVLPYDFNVGQLYGNHNHELTLNLAERQRPADP